MNDELRAKLTQQQERVKQMADWRLMSIEKDVRRAYEEGNSERVKQLEMYWLGVKDMRLSIIEAIEDEKKKTDFTGKRGE